MLVRANHQYASSADEVFAALTTPEVVVEKYRALGHRDITVLEHVATKSTVRLRTRRIVPLDVPGFAKKVLSPSNTVEQTDEWGAEDKGGVRRGTWTVSAKGVPVSLGGSLELTPRKGGGVEMVIAGEASCGLPLIGGRIAGVIGQSAEDSMAEEYRFLRRHLGETT